jgi:ABC-type uncharacterized transport system permease subunit
MKIIFFIIIIIIYFILQVIQIQFENQTHLYQYVGQTLALSPVKTIYTFYTQHLNFKGPQKQQTDNISFSLSTSVFPSDSHSTNYSTFINHVITLWTASVV